MTVGSIRGEVGAATDVIGVTVGVDEVADTIRSPRLQRADHRLAGVHARRVEADHTVAAVERDAVAEALDDRQGRRRSSLSSLVTLLTG